MSIEGINGTPSTLRVASGAVASAGASRSTSSTASRTTVEPDTVDTSGDTDTKPSTPRFPWLTGLSTQLAAASNTPTTFAAPILGDNVDQRA